jgi:hypothetical protein
MGVRSTRPQLQASDFLLAALNTEVTFPVQEVIGVADIRTDEW